MATSSNSLIPKSWLGVVNFVPNLVIALIIVILGWLIGALFGRAILASFSFTSSGRSSSPSRI